MDYLKELGYSDDLLPSKYGFEELRIKKYEVGDSFDKHVDVSDYKSARRWIAFLVYLNDNFTGGETEFLYQGIRIAPKKGTTIIFPASYTHMHRGNPPLGCKSILLQRGLVDYHVLMQRHKDVMK